MEFDPNYLYDVAIERGRLLNGVAAGAIALVAGGALAYIAGPGLKKLFRSERGRDRMLSELVPLRTILEDGKTIACEDGRLVQVVEIDGADIGSLDRKRIAALDRNREALFKAVEKEMSSRGDAAAYEIKFLFERAQRGRLRDLPWPEDQPIMEKVASRWRGQFTSRFETRFFVVISIGGRVSRAREALEELYRTVKNNLASFRPRRLGRQEKNGPSKLIAFWNRWLNGGLGADLSVAEAVDGGFAARSGNLHRILGRTEIAINHPKPGIITFEDGTRKRYCRALEIRQFPGSIHKQLALDLMSLNCECRVLLQTRILTPTELQKEVATRGMMAGNRMKPETADELDAIAHERTLTWAETRLTIFVFGDHRQQLDENVDRVRSKLSTDHFTDVAVLGAGIELVWQALFPGRQWIQTQSYLASPVLAEFTAMFRSDRGFNHCDFGEGPVTVFPTVTGEIYRFIFHNSPEPEAPGHTVIVGSTNSGKTFLIEYLLGMALRYPKLRSFVFDAFMGTYVFTNAVGGRYWSVAHGEDEDDEGATLNPLQMMPLNQSNRDFIKRWLALLVDIEGLKERDRVAYTEAMETISTAVNKLSATHIERRSLAQIFQSSFSANQLLADALMEWVDTRQRGRLFNGARDSLDLSQGRVVSFDMTEIREDPALLKALLPYLIYRIRRSVTETQSPYMMVFEETSHMLRIPSLVTFLKEELQQARKRHGVVVMAFQEPAGITAAEDKNVADVILSNAYTQILFPNPGAQAKDYAAFNLQDHEFAFLSNPKGEFRHLRRPALIRKRTQAEGFTSVVVDTDLSRRLDADTLRLFKSDARLAEAARAAIKGYGRDSWIGPYQEMASRIEREQRAPSGVAETFQLRASGG